MKEICHTTQRAIAQWLAQANTEYEDLLNQCRILPDVSSGRFVIDCPSQEVLEAIASDSYKMAQPVLKLAAPLINLSCQGETVYTFTPEDAEGYFLNMAKILCIPELVLINQILSADRPSTLIRMSDHKAIFCNDKVEVVSAAKPNNWTGEDVSRWWIDQALDEFTDALQEHGNVKEYKYRALMFTGEPRDYCVNASLVYFRGDVCRLVENLI